MIRRDDIIRAGNRVNEYMDGLDLSSDVAAAIQTLKDGCIELIRIPEWIRRHYDSIKGEDEDGLQMPDQQ